MFDIKKITVLILLITALSIASLEASPSSGAPEINLTYLKSLGQKIDLPGRKTIMLYADEASKSGEFNLIDQAHVALVFIKDYKKTKNKDSLNLAVSSLEAVLAFYDGGGSFYKTINRKGELEDKGFHYPAAWALRALTAGVSLGKDGGEISESCLQAAGKVLDMVSSEVYKPDTGPGNYIAKGGKRYPMWLLDDDSALTALYAIGILELEEVSPSDISAKLVKDLGDALIPYQTGNYNDYPFNAFLQDPSKSWVWELEYAYHPEALARAGKFLNDRIMLDGALREANGMDMHIVIHGAPIFGFGPHPLEYPRTPWGLYRLVDNLLSVSAITGDDYYAGLAGVAASWLTGNNSLQKPLYDPATGKGFGPVTGPASMEGPSLSSTLAALSIIQDISGTHAEKFINYKIVEPPHTWQVLEAEQSKTVGMKYNTEDWYYPNGEKGLLVSLSKNSTFWIRFRIKEPSKYLIYFNYLRQPPEGGAVAIESRIDAGKNYQLYQSGTNEIPLMVMDRIPEAIKLIAAYHTLGVRFSGLLFTRPVVLDSIVLQPSVEWGVWDGPGKERLVIYKNFNDEQKISMSQEPGGPVIFEAARDQRGRKVQDADEMLVPLEDESRTIQVIIPEGGSSVIRWEASAK